MEGWTSLLPHVRNVPNHLYGHSFYRRHRHKLPAINSLLILLYIINKRPPKFGDAFKTFRIWVVPKQSYCCSKIQIARSYPADRKDITCNIIIVLYSVCPQINTLQSFCKIPNPQIISVQIQSVNIMINIRMNERFDFSSTRIIMEKPLIFCTYPECAVMGGTKLRTLFPILFDSFWG